MEQRKEFTKQRNEGEGNRTAAREYNQAHDLSHDSIRRELEHAETVGRRHGTDEDPEVRPSHRKS
jgi:hypothetical protein